jgi:hypothetical protein
MTISFTNAVRNQICSQIASLANGGKLRIFAGPNATGNLLVELTLSNPAFLAPVNGSMTANPISASTVAASGTAQSWALFSSNLNSTLPNTSLMLGTVGVAGSGADLTMDNTALLVNQTAAITTFTFVAPL